MMFEFLESIHITVVSRLLGALALVCHGVYCLPRDCTLSYNKRGDVTAVDCSNKYLTSVPADIPVTVVHLNLHNNTISVIPNDTFIELSSLVDLDLSSNNLTRLEPLVFHGLTSLKVLNLASNRIYLNNESYPVDVFKDLKQLVSLNIKNNTVDGSISPSTRYPDYSFRYLTYLRELHLDGILNLSLGKGFQGLENLQLLDFNGYEGYCNLVNVSENMFSNIRTRNSFTLNMSHCEVHNIHPLTFKALPTLKVLDFENNGHLHPQNFMVASQSFSASLEVLNISTIYLGRFMTLYGKHFQYLRNTNLTTIIMENNKIICLDPEAISHLPRTVKYLSIRDNKLMDAQFLLRVVLMPSIEVFDMGRQLHYTVTDANTISSLSSSSASDQKPKEYCDRHDSSKKRIVLNGKQDSKKVAYGITSAAGSPRDVFDGKDTQSLFMKKRRVFDRYSAQSDIHMDANSVSLEDDNTDSHLDDLRILEKNPCDPAPSNLGFSIDVIPMPPTLHTLEADDIKFGYSIPNVTFSAGNSLRLLNLSYDLLYCFGGPVYGLHHLEVLDLSSNQCNDVNPFFFTDMPKLTHLYLHDNNLGWSLSIDSDGRTFSSQADLKYLDLSENRIHSLPDKIFVNLENLERLVLRDNSLSAFGARIGHMRKLKFLDLSWNQFKFLGRDLRRDLDHISLFSKIAVDLSDNSPLECTCDTFYFVQWITKTNVIIGNLNETACLLKNGSFAQFDQLEGMLSQLWLECHQQTIFMGVLIIFVCLVLAGGVLVTLYYKRWKLRYLYYIGRRRINPYNSLGGAAPVESVMDVFVSYDEEDLSQRHIVQEELLGKLEDRNISCLISETHFLCGRNTREIIEEAVLGTRKTLALLTNDFFMSRERELEFNMAVLHGMETRQDLVIPVAMETLRSETLPQEVRAFLKAYPCLSYSGDDPTFWDELVLRINATT